MDKKYNILLASDMGKVGGTEIATYITAKELQPYVQSICVFGKQGPLSDSVAKLNVEQVHAEAHTKNPFKLIQYLIRLIAVINRNNIDVIHAQMARPIPLIWLAKKLSRNKNLKIFWTSRGLNHSTYEYVVPLFNKMGVRGLGNCKLEQEKLLKYGFNPHHTSYVYNAYRLNPETAPRPKLLREKTTIGTLSALREDRCVDLFLKIAENLLKSGSSFEEVEFIIGGDGPYRSELEKLALSLGIKDKVKFYGNITDVEAFMQNLDVFVSPIVVEGDGGAGVSNAIVEAMLTKTPVCAFDASAIFEIVINNETGCLIEAKNIELMSEAIIKTIQNKEETKRLVDNAYNLIVKECDPENYAKKLISLYEKL